MSYDYSNQKHTSQNFHKTLSHDLVLMVLPYKECPALEFLYVYVSSFSDSFYRSRTSSGLRNALRALLIVLAITVGILLVWFRFYATSHLNISL